MSLMTLDEAIQHCRDKENCSQCGQEHKQLREWLEELKDLRSQYNLPKPHGRLIDADEFFNKAKEYLSNSQNDFYRVSLLQIFKDILNSTETVIEKEDKQ